MYPCLDSWNRICWTIDTGGYDWTFDLPEHSATGALPGRYEHERIQNR